MALLDLLGRRMALRVIWELSQREEPMTFRALREAADTNPAVLNARLKELRAWRIVDHDGSGYRLTKQGESLIVVLLPLHQWAEKWAASRLERDHF